MQEVGGSIPPGSTNSHPTCLVGKRIKFQMSPSSRGLGHHPFTVDTGVRIPVGTPSILQYPNRRKAVFFWEIQTGSDGTRNHRRLFHRGFPPHALAEFTGRANPRGCADWCPVHVALRMKRSWLLLCLISPCACAETLHRCLAVDRHVSYQAQACALGMRTDKTIHYVPEDTAIKPVRNQSPGRASLEGLGRKLKQRPRSSRHPVGKLDRCRTAKVRREQTLKALGLKRTYAQLSRLDEPVREACQGF